MKLSIESQIFGNDPKYDGTCIPNQDKWVEYQAPVPEMPYRPEDYIGLGKPAVFCALSFL